MRNILSEISSVERVCQTFLSCGTYETVVQRAARRPTMVTSEIMSSLSQTERSVRARGMLLSPTTWREPARWGCRVAYQLPDAAYMSGRPRFGEDQMMKA